MNWEELKHFFEKTLRTILGISLIIFGIIGLILPVLQGILMILLGLILLGSTQAKEKLKNISRTIQEWLRI